jgi:hypothetical protein
MEHGILYTYQYLGCRCDRCKAVNTASAAKYRVRRYRQPKNPDDPRHGQLGFAQNHGCKCEKCRARVRIANREIHARLRKQGLRPGAKQHGTMTGYNLYGCKCELCFRAYQDYIKDRPKDCHELFGLDPADPRHGKRSTYNRGCRCGRCRAAAKEYEDIIKARKRG